MCHLISSLAFLRSSAFRRFLWLGRSDEPTGHEPRTTSDLWTPVMVDMNSDLEEFVVVVVVV